MASGAAVVQILGISGPATLQAAIGSITGTSTPAEFLDVWDFDSAAIEYLDFKCRLVGYTGGGLTFQLAWASGATSGNVVWSIAIRRIADDAEDLDTTAQTYDYNDAAADATASAAGELAYTTVTFTDGADMDSWANGEVAIVRLRRVATDGNDTLNSNDARLFSLSGVES